MNWTVEKLHNIHKPLPYAIFEHRQRHAPTMVLSDDDDGDKFAAENASTTLEFDEDCPNPRQLFTLEGMNKWDPDEFRAKDNDVGPVRKHEVVKTTQPTTWVPSDSECDSQTDSDVEPIVNVNQGSIIDHHNEYAQSEDVEDEEPDTERKTFWVNEKPQYSVGFNSNKLVGSYLKNPPINKWGKPTAHPKDRVQCSVCGSIFLRNAGTKHRKSNKHINAANVNNVVVEAMLTVRKRRYYKKPVVK